MNTQLFSLCARIWSANVSPHLLTGTWIRPKQIDVSITLILGPIARFACGELHFVDIGSKLDCARSVIFAHTDTS